MTTKPAADAPPEAPIDGRHARRLRTEARLLAAVGEVLRQGGVAALGVNSIAEHAGVEKTLIYRYYGGVEGLLAAFAATTDFWPGLDEILDLDRSTLRGPDPARAGARVLLNYALALRRRPVTLDLLAWECSHRNALTTAVETVRQKHTQELYQALAQEGFPLGGVMGPLSNLLAAAINYLAVRGREIRTFGLLTIRTDDDWSQLEALFEVVLRAGLASASDAGRGGALPPPGAGAEAAPLKAPNDAAPAQETGPARRKPGKRSTPVKRR